MFRTITAALALAFSASALAGGGYCRDALEEISSPVTLLEHLECSFEMTLDALVGVDELREENNALQLQVGSLLARLDALEHTVNGIPDTDDGGLKAGAVKLNRQVFNMDHAPIGEMVPNLRVRSNEDHDDLVFLLEVCIPE